MKWLAACALLLLGPLAAVQAAVLGIDVGTEWITVALAQPGRPLDLVLNRDAKRQTSSAVAVDGLERRFGADAAAMSARRPAQTFIDTRGLLGVDYDSDAAAAHRYQFANEMVRAPDGSVAFAGSGDWTLTPTELVAMQLGHVRQLVRESGAGDVRDAVLAVPAHFSARQRAALADAAELAGLRVLALVSDGGAVALSFAMTRTFERAETHLIYDMGAGATVATLADFSTRGRTTGVAVRAQAADGSLGGRLLDFALRDLLVTRFSRDPAHADALRADARAMARLLREARRVKTVLSVNVQATASVEALHDGVDLSETVTRDDLEATAATLVPRVAAPVLDVLAAANRTLADIDSVVLVGGGTRVPLVQRALAEAVGADRLARTVNADEACVMGAVFKGATLSSKFKVRDARLRDAMPFAVRASYPRDDGELASTLLYPAFGAVGTRRAVRDTRTSDVAIEFESAPSEGGTGADATWAPLATARISGVADAHTRVKARHVLSDIPEVRVSARTTDLGVFEVVKADALFNVTNADADSEDAKPVVEAVSLTLDVDYHAPPRMDADAKQHARELLDRMDADDAAREAHHTAANRLESLIYRLRESVEEDGTIDVTTPDQRDALAAALAAAADWLEDHSDDATLHDLESQAAALQALDDPIAFRRSEAAERPALVAALRAVVAQAESETERIRAEFSPEAIAPAAKLQDALAPADDPMLTTAALTTEAKAVVRALADLAAANIKESTVDEEPRELSDEDSADGTQEDNAADDAQEDNAADDGQGNEPHDEL
ncbi:lumenal Hsp70 protein [Coemansia sp. RSA 552]|nr:lumenal Hsp70 protein [Coemansia sp. RSA 552]